MVRIITDNASNNIKAFEALVIPGFEVYVEPEDDEDEHDDAALSAANSEKTDAEDQEERLRIPCFSHTLQLTVGDGLKGCEAAKSALGKVAAIAKLR